MLLGLMFTLPRYAGLRATQPANLGKLVTPERDWTEKPPLMSDWRHTRGRRSHSTQKEAVPVRAWQVLSCLRALAAQGWPLDCQADRDVYVRPPCPLSRRLGISWSFTAPTCI